MVEKKPVKKVVKVVKAPVEGAPVKGAVPRKAVAGKGAPVKKAVAKGPGVKGPGVKGPGVKKAPVKKAVKAPVKKAPVKKGVAGSGGLDVGGGGVVLSATPGLLAAERAAGLVAVSSSVSVSVSDGVDVLPVLPVFGFGFLGRLLVGWRLWRVARGVRRVRNRGGVV